MHRSIESNASIQNKYVKKHNVYILIFCYLFINFFVHHVHVLPWSFHSSALLVTYSFLPAQSTSHSHLIKPTPCTWSHICSWSPINPMYIYTATSLPDCSFPLMQDSPALYSRLICYCHPCLHLTLPSSLIPSNGNSLLSPSLRCSLWLPFCLWLLGNSSMATLQCDCGQCVCYHICPCVCNLWRHSCWLSDPLPSWHRCLHALIWHHYLTLTLNWTLCVCVCVCVF